MSLDRSPERPPWFFPNAWLRITEPGLVAGTSYSGRIGQSWWLWAFDSHKDTLAGCGIDGVGRAIEYRSFANTASGHRRALEWVRQLDAGRVASCGVGRLRAAPGSGAGRSWRRVGGSATPGWVLGPEGANAAATSPNRSDALLIARVGGREDDLPKPRPEGVIEDPP